MQQHNSPEVPFWILPILFLSSSPFLYIPISVFLFCCVGPLPLLSVDSEVTRLNLRRYRFQHGWTQEDIAAALDVDQSAISHWESGQGLPCRKNRRKLAELFHCTEEEIFGDSLKNARKLKNKHKRGADR